MKKLCVALFAFALLASCDELAIERDDVVRFDRTITANGASFDLNNTVVKPYETEELKKYRTERDKIKEFDIYRIEFRLFNFRSDNDSSLINGTADIISEAGTTFQMELYDQGDEYKDTQNHELHSLSAAGASDDASAYDLLAQEMVASDELTINTANLNGIVDSLDCDLSVYIHYRIKAE